MTGKKGKGGDESLWDAVTRDVQPLKGREPAPVLPVPAPPAADPPRRPAENAPPAPPRTPLPIPPHPRAPDLPEITAGRAPGLDKRTAQRMRRGQLAIEGRIDLHGMTQDEAFAALYDCLADAQAAGRRCVLVITGKGRVSQDGGVLRNQVPRWLNQPPNRARVLAFETAQPKHGGGGALYVLLKKGR